MLQDHVSEIIAERKAELNGESTANHIERKDVFSLLVRASEEDSKFRLNDNELVSNNVKQSNPELTRPWDARWGTCSRCCLRDMVRAFALSS